jgi:hypothetical protein
MQQRHFLLAKKHGSSRSMLPVNDGEAPSFNRRHDRRSKLWSIEILSNSAGVYSTAATRQVVRSVRRNPLLYDGRIIDLSW